MDSQNKESLILKNIISQASKIIDECNKGKDKDVSFMWTLKGYLDEDIRALQKLKEDEKD